MNKHYPAVALTLGVSVADAKKMYKQFHQKNPSKVEKKTMNIGETWIGLGKAWSIGYRSGKETGDAEPEVHSQLWGRRRNGKKIQRTGPLLRARRGGSDDLLIVTGGIGTSTWMLMERSHGFYLR